MHCGSCSRPVPDDAGRCPYCDFTLLGPAGDEEEQYASSDQPEFKWDPVWGVTYNGMAVGFIFVLILSAFRLLAALLGD